MRRKEQGIYPDEITYIVLVLNDSDGYLPRLACVAARAAAPPGEANLP